MAPASAFNSPDPDRVTEKEEIGFKLYDTLMDLRAPSAKITVMIKLIRFGPSAPIMDFLKAELQEVETELLQKQQRKQKRWVMRTPPRRSARLVAAAEKTK